MIHSHSRALLPLTFLALGASAARAQATLHSGHEVANVSPSAHGGFDPTSTSVGDLDGDREFDLIFVSHSLVRAKYWVDAMNSEEVLPDLAGGLPQLMANDAAILRDGGGQAPDAVVAVGDSGLQILRLDANLDWTLEHHVSGPWSGASQLEIVDWDNNGYLDILALDSSGTSVITHLWDGSAWADGPSVQMPGSVEAYCSLDWNASGPLEIAVTTSSALHVVVEAGPVDLIDYTRSSPLAPGRIAPVDHGSLRPEDSIAWLVGPAGNGHSYISIFGKWTVPTVLELQNFQPESFFSGDATGDGLTDLMATDPTSFDMVLAEQAPDASFSAAFLEEVDCTPEPLMLGDTGVQATAIADLDHDGFLDLVLAQTSASGFHLLRGPMGTASLSVDGARRTLTKGSASICTNTAGDGYFSIELEYESLPAGTAFLELLTFTQDTANQQMNDTAHSACYWVGSSTNFYQIDFDIPGPLESGHPLSTDWIADDRLFHFVVRPVDSNLQVTGPNVLATFSMDYAAIQTQIADDDWDGHQIFTGVSDCDPPSPNGTPHGGVVKIKRFLPGTPPRLHYDVGCVTPDNTPPTP